MEIHSPQFPLSPGEKFSTLFPSITASGIEVTILSASSLPIMAEAPLTALESMGGLSELSWASDAIICTSRRSSRVSAQILIFFPNSPVKLIAVICTNAPSSIRSQRILGFSMIWRYRSG